MVNGSLLGGGIMFLIFGIIMLITRKRLPGPKFRHKTDKIGIHAFNVSIGIFMILIGLFGIYKAFN